MHFYFANVIKIISDEYLIKITDFTVNLLARIRKVIKYSYHFIYIFL